ncbi:MAG: TRAP transporter large permease [Burkholderiaceae bacterium]
MIIFLSIFFLLVLLIGGLWMGVALSLAGVAVLYFGQGGTAALSIVTMGIWNILYSFPLVALPLFILLGELFISFGLSVKVYNALAPLLERFSGKLLISNVALCAVFGAASGSSMATAAAIGSVAYPELRKKGYDKRALVGNLAGAGTLGILVPPSIPIIIYAALTNVSVGASFVAAVIPAAVAVIMFIAFVTIQVRLKPSLVPTSTSEVVSLRQALIALHGLIPIVVLVASVMGTIYFGIATTTEAAALGVLAVVLISFAYRAFSFEAAAKALVGTSLICASIGFIMMGAMVFSMALATTGLPRTIVMVVQNWELSSFALIMAIFALYLILGCFFGATEMLVTTLPFTFPLVLAAGYDPVWFAVAVVILCEMGQITPPVGVNLFVLQSITGGDATLGDVARGAFPYFLILGLLLMLITVFPQMTTYLPSLM